MVLRMLGRGWVEEGEDGVGGLAGRKKEGTVAIEDIMPT